ncbi:hypothetical protein VCHA53O466_40194 [Vibrio chagasii]|nr:hypothetical protein VCHA53O466_40194 [Vibrio chagasii]
MSSNLSFLNPKRLAEQYGEAHFEYFKAFCLKSQEFIKHRQINPTKACANLRESITALDNISPTAFILDFMINGRMALTHRYLDLIFNTNESPITAATTIMSEFPSLSAALSGFTNGDTNSHVPFIASDIIVTRYTLFKYPLIKQCVTCDYTPSPVREPFNYIIETADDSLSIVCVTPTPIGSHVSDFLYAMDGEIGNNTFALIESANISANGNGVGSNNLYFALSLDSEGLPLNDIPEIDQLSKVICSTMSIASGTIEKSSKREVLLSKLNRTTKNHKSLISKITATQDLYKNV